MLKKSHFEQSDATIFLLGMIIIYMLCASRTKKTHQSKFFSRVTYNVRIKKSVHCGACLQYGGEEKNSARGCFYICPQKKKSDFKIFRFQIFRFQISKISDFRFQKFQISDFKMFRFQISKFSDFRFQNVQISKKFFVFQTFLKNRKINFIFIFNFKNIFGRNFKEI